MAPPTPGEAPRKRTPKLCVGADTASHVILSTSDRAGLSSDAPSFDTLVYRGSRRGRVKTVLADAGFDSEANHRIARRNMLIFQYRNEWSRSTTMDFDRWKAERC